MELYHTHFDQDVFINLYVEITAKSLCVEAFTP